MPKFAASTKVEIKKSLAQRPELSEFFSDNADYSRMAKERVHIDDVHHTVTMYIYSHICMTKSGWFLKTYGYDYESLRL
jgi:serine protease inhibitor